MQVRVINQMWVILDHPPHTCMVLVTICLIFHQDSSIMLGHLSELCCFIFTATLQNAHHGIIHTGSRF
jgi:hypothetical protein